MRVFYRIYPISVIVPIEPYSPALQYRTVCNDVKMPVTLYFFKRAVTIRTVMCNGRINVAIDVAAYFSM
jgi:hypothetical protein